MKKLIYITIALSLLLGGCSEEKKQDKVVVKDIKKAFTLKKEAVKKTLDLPAELLPYEKATLNAKVEGYIRKLYVDIGDDVKKGDVLVVLDAPEVAARYAEAKAKYNEANAKYEGSLDTYNRMEKASQTPGVIAESELINTKNRMMADKSSLTSAEATVKAYRQLQSYLTLRAPFDGKITERFINVGDYAGGTGKKELLTIETTDELRVRIFVPESYVNTIPLENELSFTTDAISNTTFKAPFSRKSGSIDKDTRTELWEYKYDNKEGALKPGMYTMSTIEVERPTPSFIVPPTAIVTSMEKKFIIRVNNNKVEWIDVRQGITSGKKVEIFGDLQEGDTILFRGSAELKEGSSIEVQLER